MAENHVYKVYTKVVHDEQCKCLRSIYNEYSTDTAIVNLSIDIIEKVDDARQIKTLKTLYLAK